MRAEANDLEDATEADNLQELASSQDAEKLNAKSRKDIKQEERDNQGDFLEDQENSETEYA